MQCFEKHSLSSSRLQDVVRKSFAFRCWKIFPPRLSYLWLISLSTYSFFAVQNIVWISYILLHSLDSMCSIIRIFPRFEFQSDVVNYNPRNRNSMRTQRNSRRPYSCQCHLFPHCCERRSARERFAWLKQLRSIPLTRFNAWFSVYLGFSKWVEK